MSPSCRRWVCMIVALILCVVTTPASASGSMTTLFGKSDFVFHHEVTLNTSSTQLEFLTTFNVEHGESFVFQFDVKFPLGVFDDIGDRVLLYLLACDQAATQTFLNFPLNPGTLVPSYCAMPNRTLDYYCQSFPLENQSTDKTVYHSTRKVIGSMENVTSQTNFDKMLMGSNSTNLTFYIDACEMLGGSETILRSCLEYPPPTTHSTANGDQVCYYCPKNYPGLPNNASKQWSETCEISPAVKQVVLGTVSMNLCAADGECLWQSNRYLLLFYGGSVVLWSLGAVVWMIHLYCAPPGSAVALHVKLLSVPLTQVIYSGLSFATKSTASHFASPKFNLLAIVTLVAQFVALARSADVALFLAAGWGITQTTLERIDVIRIRWLAVEWALTFVGLKQLKVDNVGLAVIWGVSWFAIIFLIHYYSAVNLKMLRLRYRIGERINIDTCLVLWKGTLFLRYQRLQKGYVFIATITALAGSDNHWHIWEWISVQGHETLIFLLYAVLAYICRCQQFRFSELENLEIDVGEDTGAAPTQDNASSDPVSSSNVTPVLEESVRKKVATALVLNPDKSVMLGTTHVLENPTSTDISLPKENEDANGGTNPAANPAISTS